MPRRPRLRLVLALSLDGRLAPPQGGAAQIGGRGDRTVLEQALAWSDAALLGAETLRRHGSTCLIHRRGLLLRRRLSGRRPQPIAIVASRSGQLPPELPFFRQPLERWLLQPGVPAGPVPAGFQRCLRPRHWNEGLAQLADAGIARLVVLGGAALAADLLAADLLDELQLTLCPRLLGGDHCWLPVSARPQPTPWRLRRSRRLPGEEIVLLYERGPAA